MAYNKNVWQNGEVITAEKLNHIEDGIKENENEYIISSTLETLFEGDLVLELDDGYCRTSFIPEADIDADEIKVTLNNGVYTLQKVTEDGVDNYWYGDQDFVTYPFDIYCEASGSSYVYDLEVPDAGTYSLKIETGDITVETSENFRLAVKNAEGNNTLFVEVLNVNDSRITDKTGQELIDAIKAGKNIVFWYTFPDSQYNEVVYHSVVHIYIDYTDTTYTVANRILIYLAKDSEFESFETSDLSQPLIEYSDH